MPHSDFLSELPSVGPEIEGADGCAFTSCSFFSAATDLEGVHQLHVSATQFRLSPTFSLLLERLYHPGYNSSISHLGSNVYGFFFSHFTQWSVDIQRVGWEGSDATSQGPVGSVPLDA